MMNVLLEAEGLVHEPNETELVYIRGGALQIGQNVSINGSVVMDYSSEVENKEWKADTGTPSDAVERNDVTEEHGRIEKVLPLRPLDSITGKARTAAFHIDNDSFDVDEENVELTIDRTTASTWRTPIVELIQGFDGSSGEYRLEVRDNDNDVSRELVTTLYADESTKEEFLGHFTLAESEKWNLQVETDAAAQLRDTGSENEVMLQSFAFGEEILTRKTLIASRSLGEAKVIYWNPGAAITVAGETYPAGDDGLFDGSNARAPLKTWRAAAEEARRLNGIVVAMQSLNLGEANAGEYLEQQPGGEFYLSSAEELLITPLGTWNSTAQPAIIVPGNKTLMIENLYLGGMYDSSGHETESQSILVNEGDLIIGKNVRTEEKGYIQLNAFFDLANHPIQVCSLDSIYDGDLRIFFGGINNNVAYRYVDVVIPGRDLEELISNDTDPAAKADAIGQALLGRLKLHSFNQSVANGGLSNVDWLLRQDTGEEGSIAKAQNIELYATYYFDGIYIDGVNGDDRNYGASCNYPVKTWARARAIWQNEMTKSLQARQNAAGLALERIETDFPMPEVIYICNTVTVDSAGEPEWELETRYDYARNTEIKTEVVSHIDNIAVREEGNTKEKRHEAPKTMIKVTGQGILNIRDVFIRNMVDDTDSVTIKAEAGGTLNLNGETTLTGTRLKSAGFTQKELTLGNHVTVTGGSRFVMKADWTGSIENKEQGVVAAGSGATVEMNNGLIQKNNSYRGDYFSAGITTHKSGGGMALSGGAQFTMNGGTITGNQTYQYGAGVYLADAGTAFIMNKGKISNNSLLVYTISSKNSTLLYSQGAGIFAGSGTMVKIGDGTGGPEDTLISNNKAYLAYGTGIHANGSLMIDHAAISDNIGGGITNIGGGTNLGVGIYIGPNGTLTMKDGLVKGNHGAFTSYGSVLGAGIFMAAGKNSHSIADSIIGENETGNEYSTSYAYSQGGGIYLSGGNTLTITGTTISNNRAIRGGGIYSAGSLGQETSLTLKDTVIKDNKGLGYRNTIYGDSGGIYFYGYGTLTLKDGTKIIDNYAAQHSAGLFIGGNTVTSAHVYMMASTPGAIEISGNTVTNIGGYGAYGGGVTHSGGSWHAENVRISNNTAVTQGGGIYCNSTNAYSYFKNMIITDNLAMDGAGLGISGGRFYMQDSVVSGNTAANRGGGIYLSSGNSYMYLSETESGKFEIKDNYANYGGGISILNSNVFMLDIAGPIQNGAAVQGSNFHLSGYANIDILNGHFKQPVASEQVEGVYSFYIDDTSTNAYSKYFDFSKITADKKEGDHPDVIFLNSGSSFLTVLAAPANENAAYGSFPIDLNKDVFQSGSVVLKPSGKNVKRVMLEPNADLSGTRSVNKAYPDLISAIGNLDYYRGGELPRRSQLGGFKDAIYSDRTNVIIVGQGVYLAGYKSNGSGGNDSNGGTSPADAVATFDRAKEVLKDRINESAVHDNTLLEVEREGFAPFIYICGQVDINTDEFWELNYEDPLYTDTNKYYGIAEERNGNMVYDSQIRRFASFVRQPMINVGNGINAVSFTAGRLIIDGMADTVVLADQSVYSPVVSGNAGSKVTLTGDSMIRNNYYCAMDIYGQLTLKGESGEVNKQLYNNQSQYTVRLYDSAKMSMQGEARIITDNTVEKIANFSSYGIWVGGSKVSISMEGNSAIMQGQDSLLMNSYMIYSGYTETAVQMKDNARLEVGNGVGGGIYASGSDSTIAMSGDASIVTTSGAYWTYGIYLGNNTSLTMSDRANITYRGNRSTTTYGITLNPSSNTTASVKMQDHAAIIFDSAVQGTSYWFYGISIANGTSPKVEMLNHARITGNPNNKLYTCGIITNSASATNAIISLNMEDTGSQEESVSIIDMDYGIYLGATENSSVSMGKKAVITGGSNGIYLTGRSNATSTAKIFMKDSGRIYNNTYGIYFYQNNSSPINIRMEGHAAIEQNVMGIAESTMSSSTSYGASHVNIEMFEDSRISGNSSSGIQLFHAYSSWSEDTGYQKITLNDNAVIGGSGYYSSSDAASGNKGSGIYANGPIQVTMNGTARISGNGTNLSGDSWDSSGIYLTRTANVTYHRAGTARITLNDSATISDNKGSGVYSATIGDVTTSYHNQVIIELNGMKDDGGLSEPSIQGNTDAVFLGSDTTLSLKGKALVKSSDTPYESGTYVARSINNYGYIELDGRSTVKGLIYMNNSTKPITMTHGATGQAPKYSLHLVEGFAGKTVVQPDMVGITDLTGTNSQLAYFNKVSAEGMAATRPIVELTPNLVLLGENNVYLSGSGNDSNTGNTPSTAVRTFKRAKELLQGGGYYTTGANIIICTSTVNVLAADNDWSFDSGGYIQNSLSGHRWQPLVIRYEKYGGVMITLNDSTDMTYASTVTFKNITVDGGSANGIVLTTSANDQLLTVGRGKTVILETGAVLQNNKAVTTVYSNYTALGVKVIGGTLEINGGTIRNIVRETSGTISIYGFASAVMVQGLNTSYPGKLIMNSGQIINNELIAPKAQSTSARLGTVYVSGTASAPGSMEMRGGLIEHNKVVSMNTNPVAGGAVVNCDGVVKISGGMIRENEGGCGSAIFHYSTGVFSQLLFSGGQISKNTTNAAGQQPVNKYSPIFVLQRGFELCGGGADISDSIYLYQPLSAIKISDHIYQSGRSYRVYLNQGNSYFKKGSVVVEPDGNQVTNVGAYLSYFDIRSNPYVLDRGRTGKPAGNVSGVKEEQCLILMKAVYLDSVNGKDNNTGLKPSQAVKSFTRAKNVGQLTVHGTSDHFVIYVCGKAMNTSSESVWTLPETAYMCRYTGFPVYEADGTKAPETERAYYGYLIQPDYDLTFKDITIQGRRSEDSAGSNGDSLVNIPADRRVTVESGAVFLNNNNSGNYPAEDGFVDNLNSKGGAFYVAERGTLTIRGGEIRGNNATYGSAIYLQASESNPSSFGQLYLTGSPVISGNVYLNGTANITSAFVQPDASYVPSFALQISVGNDYNGRPLIQYRDGTVPGEAELNYYSFDDAVKALYDIVNNSSNASILELSLRRVIYLDGQNGSDDPGNDGTTPEKAFKTLKRTFEAIGNQASTNGVLIYIVDTLDISGGNSEPSDIQLMNIKVYNSDGTTHYEGYYKDPGEVVNIRGQVYFKRYSQPKDYDAADPVYEGYSKKTLLDSLFYIENGGTLTLNGIYLDGHSISSDSINPTLVAPAVVAQSPLVTVKGSGVLQCYRADGVNNGIPTTTLFINNVNERNKNAPEYIVGHLNDSDIMEGSSAGIELLDEGTCILEYTEFSNLALGDQVISGGTDVYSNGNLHFSRYTNFGGSVFLEGFGTKQGNQNTSRYLTVDVYGTPIQNKFHVMVRDPYGGRDMVHYSSGINATANDAGYFLLEERVKDFFCLKDRSGYPNILELQVPVAVYIDGTNGTDDQSDRFAGSTPKFPIKTLGRAFELLKTRGGNTIYVVGTIQVNNDIQITGQSYIGTDKTVMLGSTDKINIFRYMQPDFAFQNPVAGAAAEYDVEDYKGVLLNVRDGATARFSSNVSFNGHSEPMASVDLPANVTVNRNGEAKAPLITVQRGGALNLLRNVTLCNNNNTYDPENDLTGRHGGAIFNSGTTTVDNTLFDNNKAEKGAVAYQDGTFTIVSAPEKLAGHQNTFYLTSENTGTGENPIWGTDHVIQTAVAMPDHEIFDVDMDHGVKGRAVVRFISSSAYYPSADAEHEHFRLGSTVPGKLFLVEAEIDPDVLELQDWEVLHVEVPADIYLVVRRRGSFDSTNKLVSVNDTSFTDLFTTPDYWIKNKGIYDVRVLISGFENKTVEAGITTDPANLMNLTASAAVTTADQDLYLAVKGLDDMSGGSGFAFPETSLKPYAESTVTAAPIVLGTLKTQTTGKFTFLGAVGNGFVDKYMDASFPIEGSTKAEVKKYMDGTSDSGLINARAKYLMKYKVEIVPARRTP